MVGCLQIDDLIEVALPIDIFEGNIAASSPRILLFPRLSIGLPGLLLTILGSAVPRRVSAQDSYQKLAQHFCRDMVAEPSGRNWRKSSEPTKNAAAATCMLNQF